MCTVEPVIGIIKEVLGSCYGQFSLRGLTAAAGRAAWCLVCLTFNLKRLAQRVLLAA